MPKRKEPVATSETQKEKVTNIVIEEAVVIENGNVVEFSEKELRELSTEQLKDICALYKIDFNDGARNTTAKLTRIILAEQLQVVADGSGTPKGLGKYKATGNAVDNKTQSTVIAGKLTVRYDLSITKNLGDYNSLKMQAGVELPIDYTDNDLVKAKESLEVARVLVTDKIVADLADAVDTFNAK